MRESEVDKVVCYAYQQVTGIFPEDTTMYYAQNTDEATAVASLVAEQCHVKSVTWEDDDSLAELIEQVTAQADDTAAHIQLCYEEVFGTYPEQEDLDEYFCSDLSALEQFNASIHRILDTHLEWSGTESLGAFTRRIGKP